MRIGLISNTVPHANKLGTKFTPMLIIWTPLVSKRPISYNLTEAGDMLNSKGYRWYDPELGRFISKDTYEGDISNPLSLNLYTYVHNNPLIFIDPTGHEALPNIDWEEFKREGLKVIQGGAKGSNKGKIGGLLGAFFGAVAGALLQPNSAGESQEVINQSNANYLNLPLISSEQLNKLREDDNNILLYDEDVKTLHSGKGILAKDVLGEWTPEEHILFGADDDAWYNDPWISTSADPSIPFTTFNGDRNGVVVIDAGKINSIKLYFPTISLTPGTTAYQLAVNDREVLVKYSIPQEAIFGVMYLP
jgi:RHS repeat-associated protein